MNPRYRSRVGAPPQLAADAAASAIYCAMPFLVVHYLGDWRLTPPWLVLPAGMLAVTLYCLIRELAAVTIADGNICLHRLGFKVTEFPLEELRSAKLIFKNGQCSRVYLSVHEETDLRRALRTANRRGGKSIQFAATTKRLEQLTKLVLLQPCDYAKKKSGINRCSASSMINEFHKSSSHICGHLLKMKLSPLAKPLKQRHEKNQHHRVRV